MGPILSLKEFSKFEEKKRERKVAMAFSERNKCAKSLSFLKPTLSTYRMPSRFRLELYGIKIMETTNGISYARAGHTKGIGPHFATFPFCYFPFPFSQKCQFSNLTF